MRVSVLGEHAAMRRVPDGAGTLGRERGEVLGRVALESAERDEPQIVSLCVDEAGRVGDGYAVAVR